MTTHQPTSRITQLESQVAAIHERLARLELEMHARIGTTAPVMPSPWEGTLDWLADEPDLYSLDDGEPV